MIKNTVKRAIKRATNVVRANAAVLQGVKQALALLPPVERWTRRILVSAFAEGMVPAGPLSDEQTRVLLDLQDALKVRRQAKP